MINSSKKDFIKFALGFLGMISLGFVVLVGVGFYEMEISDNEQALTAEAGV